MVHDMQLSIGSVEQIVTVDNKGVSTDSDRNADALVLGLKELEALPTDPDALAAALQAMAGPSLGDENGGTAQIKVDGFSNGKIPPKDQIREVRINQNPYSAENEYPGWGGIEIYTQPGSDKFHGSAAFNFNDGWGWHRKVGCWSLVVSRSGFSPLRQRSMLNRRPRTTTDYRPTTTC